jgi:heme-degrading monooxygenase HmoA
MTGTYVSISRLRIAPDRVAALIEAFGNRSGDVEHHDGFIDLQVLQSDRDPGDVLMISRWRDRDCFTAYMKSEDHRRSHARIDPELRKAIKLQALEHLHVVAE